jgi:hypothetical protein
MKSWRIRWTEHVAWMEKMRNVCRILVVNPDGKRPQGTHRCRWKDIIKMDLREIWCELDSNG